MVNINNILSGDYPLRKIVPTTYVLLVVTPLMFIFSSISWLFKILFILWIMVVIWTTYSKRWRMYLSLNALVIIETLIFLLLFTFDSLFRFKLLNTFIFVLALLKLEGHYRQIDIINKILEINPLMEVGELREKVMQTFKSRRMFKLKVSNKNNDVWRNFLDKLLDLKIKKKYKEIIDLFFIPDNIDSIKFQANLEILKYNSREEYKSIVSFDNRPDLSEYGTATIDKFAEAGYIPEGYEVWFIAAYPDVADWFQDVLENRASEILDISNEKLDDDKFWEEEICNSEGKTKIEYLRRIIDAFKKEGKKLELTSHPQGELGWHTWIFLLFR